MRGIFIPVFFFVFFFSWDVPRIGDSGREYLAQYDGS